MDPQLCPQPVERGWDRRAMPSKALGSRRSRAARRENGDTLSQLPPSSRSKMPCSEPDAGSYSRYERGKEVPDHAGRAGIWDRGAANKHTGKARGQEMKSTPRMFLTQTLA